MDENAIVIWYVEPSLETNVIGTTEVPTNFTYGMKYGDRGLMGSPSIQAHYAINRYYNMNTGRWWQPDPLGSIIDIPDDDIGLSIPYYNNIYSYLKNNPLKYSDPFGLIVMLSPTYTYYPAAWPNATIKSGLVCINNIIGNQYNLIITDGYRTKEQNDILLKAGVNAAKSVSQHTLNMGNGADFYTVPFISNQKILCAAAKCSFTWGSTKYDNPHIHIDQRFDRNAGNNELPKVGTCKCY